MRLPSLDSARVFCLLVGAGTGDARPRPFLFHYLGDPVDGEAPLFHEPFPEPVAFWPKWMRPRPVECLRRRLVVVSRRRFPDSPVVIGGLAFARFGKGYMAEQSVRVRMAHTASDVPDDVGNSTTWLQTVLHRRYDQWPHRFDEWWHMELQKPFTYSSEIGNLLIELRTEGKLAIG